MDKSRAYSKMVLHVSSKGGQAWHPPAMIWGYSLVVEYLHGMQVAGVQFSLSPQWHFGQVDEAGVRFSIGPQ